MMVCCDSAELAMVGLQSPRQRAADTVLSAFSLSVSALSFSLSRHPVGSYGENKRKGTSRRTMSSFCILGPQRLCAALMLPSQWV